MTEWNRKDAQRKPRRAPRRGTEAWGGNQDAEASEQAKRKPDQASPKAGNGGAEPKLDDGGNVSSLLETSGNEVRQLLEAADQAAAKIREAAETDVAARDEQGVKNNEALSLISKTNDEVRKVLEAAQDAAEKIRHEARAEARQLIEETRRQAESVTSEQMGKVSKMTEEVLGELGGVQERLETLRSAFDKAIETMGAEVGIEQTAVWDTRNGDLGEEEESAELRSRLGKRRKMVPPREPEGISEGARLLALQQLMAGVDADVIEERLRNEFGIKEPGPILEWMGLQSAKSEKSKKR